MLHAGILELMQSVIDCDYLHVDLMECDKALNCTLHLIKLVSLESFTSFSCVINFYCLFLIFFKDKFYTCQT